jgi:hypothetical protein
MLVLLTMFHQNGVLQFLNLFVYDFVCLQNEVISSVQELKETVESQACKMYVLTPK